MKRSPIVTPPLSRSLYPSETLARKWEVGCIFLIPEWTASEAAVVATKGDIIIGRGGLVRSYRPDHKHNSPWKVVGKESQTFINDLLLWLDDVRPDVAGKVREGYCS